MSSTTRNPVPLIELQHIAKTFGSKTILRDVSLQVEPGEIFTILGGSGSGKSVCLKHMNLLLRPDQGKVLIDGEDVTDYRENDLVDVRKRVTMLFQSGALFDSLTVFENVAYPLREHLKLSEAELQSRVAECLESVGLPGTENLMPSELSGGMRKRIGLARSIALKPDCIIYDEPTTGLDPANARRIGKLIGSLRERFGITSVVVTHELDLCFEISDRVALLSGGVIVESGPAQEFSQSANPIVQSFLRGSQDEEGFEMKKEGE